MVQLKLEITLSVPLFASLVFVQTDMAQDKEGYGRRFHFFSYVSSLVSDLGQPEIQL